MENRPIFIIGSPRSGTSIFAVSLAQHNDLWTSAESDFLVHLLRGNNVLRKAYDQAYNRPDHGWLFKNNMDYSEFAKHIGKGFNSIFDSRSNGLRWIDQTPGNTLIVKDLIELFPNAQFLHIQRDGRLVVNSMINSKFEKLGFSMDWCTDFNAACKAWSVYTKAAKNFCSEHPLSSMTIKYEDLVSDPDNQFSQIFNFLGVEKSELPKIFLTDNRINSSFDQGFKSLAQNKNKISNPIRKADEIWLSWTEEQRSIFSEVTEKYKLASAYL